MSAFRADEKEAVLIGVFGVAFRAVGKGVHDNFLAEW
jgi:hypothetical protein